MTGSRTLIGFRARGSRLLRPWLFSHLADADELAGLFVPEPEGERAQASEKGHGPQPGDHRVRAVASLKVHAMKPRRARHFADQRAWNKLLLEGNFTASPFERSDVVFPAMRFAGRRAPFAGALTPRERTAILKEHAAEDEASA